MKLAILSTLCSAFLCGSAAQATENQHLMEQIESAVTLPEGALPIDQYSRNYAFRPDGKVLAIYVRPRPSLWEEKADYGCEVLLPDFESRPCTADETAEMIQNDETTAVRFGAADEARWFDDYLELPVIEDGGCDQIAIVYNPKSKAVESAACNGMG